jgi:SHS family lactate transporter-like MFS transporter
VEKGVFSGWTREQKSVVIAAYLGWSLDAFDFFLLVFVLRDIAMEFSTDIASVSIAVTLTLISRPVGAFIFGRAADRYGRRPALIVDVLAYSFLAFVSGFAPSLTALIALRALFGVAMGGEWGIGASLTMETVPAQSRGFVSGVLQCGYPTGFLVASLAYALLYTHISWRGMIMLGALPALLVLYIRRNVPESPIWTPQVKAASGTLTVAQNHWRLAIYMILLMTAFNFFSHGTQDLYPTFLQVQQGLGPSLAGPIAVIANVGAICGSLAFGSLSERIGRRRGMVTAALCSLPVIPLWVLAPTPFWLAIGAFLMQFAVQSAWGIIPVHLNELSPPEARGTFPGFTYQLGNLLASANATIQAGLAERHGNNYGMALALIGGCAAVAIAVLAGFGVERKGVHMGESVLHKV